jgi:hypothetical protein
MELEKAEARIYFSFIFIPKFVTTYAVINKRQILLEIIHQITAKIPKRNV